MIVNGMIVESLDKTVKGQVLSYDYDKDLQESITGYMMTQMKCL